MPVELTWMERGLIYRLSEIVTGAEIIEQSKAATSHPNWKKIKYEIVDLGDLVDAKTTDDDLKDIARIDIEGSKLNPDVKVVIVFDREKNSSINEKFMRYFMSVISEAVSKHTVVRTIEEAKSSLIGLT